jgi:hypothetical protein
LRRLASSGQAPVSDLSGPGALDDPSFELLAALGFASNAA